MAMQGAMMDAQAAGSRFHNAKHVLTDTTLALLQDSGWCGTYSLKYLVGSVN